MNNGVNYKNYTALLARYNKLDETQFSGQESLEELIGKLIAISREKKEIQAESNAIIREYVTQYETSPNLVDANVEETLKDFSGMLISSTGQIFDPPIAFLISKILLQYYQREKSQIPRSKLKGLHTYRAAELRCIRPSRQSPNIRAGAATWLVARGNKEQSILMLERCTVLDIMLKEHLDDYEGTSYHTLIEQYLPYFDTVSERAKRALANCRLLSVINRRDMTFALRQYRKVEKEFMKMRESMGDGFMYAQFIMCKANALAFALEACRRAEYARNFDTSVDGPAIDLEKETPLIKRLGEELEEILQSDNVDNILSDTVVIRIYCAQAAYHTGSLTIEELLDRLEEYAKPQEGQNALEECTALFTANAYYMDYLHKCRAFDEQYVLQKSKEIVKHVLTAAKKKAHQYGNYQINHCVLMLVNSASNIIDFGAFKNTVLEATVYANKALFVHTMTIKEICIVLLNYVIEHDPAYLDGVAGYHTDDIVEHRKQILELMENCALFHDIGKYFCLDYVSNSFRKLTDDEFDIIKAHPSNFSKIYHGKLNPETECIHDCALLHHVWYNETGGYPQEKHTRNKPFVNILSIADSLDAATDNIGRPYGMGKTLDELIAEFDAMQDTRYSSYVSRLLHIREVRQKVEQVLQIKRKEIYYHIYHPGQTTITQTRTTAIESEHEHG